MAAVAHSPGFAKKAGVPQSVGRDFNEADKGRKFSKGGDTMATNPKMAAIMAAKRAGPSRGAPMGGMPPGAGAGAGGPPMPTAPAPGGMPGMKKGGETKKMAKGGRTDVMDGDTGDRFADGEKKERKVGSSRGPGGMMMAKGGVAKDGAPRQLPDNGRISKSRMDIHEGKKKPEKAFAKGGYVRDADGIASRGKTRGKFI